MKLTRLGWGILIAILLAGALFASMLRIGSGPAALPRAPAAPPPAARAQPADGQLTMPVANVPHAALVSNWGDARDEGERAHTGLDIAAPGGTPVVAAAPGFVERLWWSEAGGNTIYIRSPDRSRIYYYAHLASYAPGLGEGLAVRAGQVIGAVGDTGNAGENNTHLHFGVTRLGAGDHWYQGEPIDPYPLLAAP